jgi:hypothetical protein
VRYLINKEVKIGGFSKYSLFCVFTPGEKWVFNEYLGRMDDGG